MDKHMPKERLVIALAGNPNVGKSTIFNGLTGLRQHTGNWTGKTVSTAKGYFETEKNAYELVDIPGAYSLMANSAEEEAAADFLLFGNMDAVVVVCDATCLERNLNLVLQIMQICPNVLVCLNLMDEAAKKGIKIDRRKLGEELGASVVCTSARDSQTLSELVNALDVMKIREKEETVPQLLDRKELFTEQDVAAFLRRGEEICRKAVQFDNRNYHEKDRRIDKVLTGRWSAYPVMAFLLVLILWLTIKGANYPSEILADFLFSFQKRLDALFDILRMPQWIQDMLILGVYRVAAWVVAVMLPPMAIFFPLFTLLEDAGYLPRIAFNLDRPFKCCRACGKQALTMCMGLVYLQHYFNIISTLS